MKRPESRSLAFTLIELLVVLATVAVLALVLIPAHAGTRANVARITCTDNLKRIGWAFRTWAEVHQDRYPMRVANSQGGTSGNLVNQTLAFTHFAVLSNQPRFRSWRVSFHAVATPISGGHGTVSAPDFNCGAVVASHAQTRS